MRAAPTLLFASALFFASVGSCWAQAGRSELFGVVQDPTDRSVSAARLLLTEQSTGAKFEVQTNDQGQYHFLGLASGTYLLTADKPGFGPFRKPEIQIRLASQTRLDITLQLGESSQTVEVHDDTVSFTAGERTIANLPLDGRNFIPLTTLSPGVALPGGGSLLPRINGSRPRTNEYIYDGISVLQPEPGQVVFYPIIDAMEEFKININAYSPEYGRSNGGTVIVSGKSGSNQFHGTVFEFFRNEALNARNYFAQPGAKPEFRRNQYGFTLGGPIRSNRTFFFVDWQGTRLRTGLTRFSTVPTLVQRTTVAPSLIDPIAQQVLGHYPVPNRSGSANNFVLTGVEPDSQDQFETRIDHVFNQRHRGFVRYGFLRDDDTPVAPLPDGSGTLASGVTGHAITRGDSVASEYDWTFSPSTLNQFRFGYTRRKLDQTSLQTGNIAVPNAPASAFSSVLPIFSINGFQQVGPTSAANTNFQTDVTEYVDTVSMVRGKHTLKYGFDIRREALDVLNPPNPTGTYGFTSVNSLLLGQVNNFSIDIQNQALHERAHIAEFFLGDEWRASSRLTLNIGTRYTLNFPSYEANGHGAVFNLHTQQLDFPKTARDLECCNFGPRVGLAYRLSDSWVVRSGYGMVWFEQSGVTTPFTLPQFPFVQTVTQIAPDNLHPAFVLSQGPTVQPRASNDPNAGLGQGVFGTQRNNGSGYSQQWNLTLEKTLGTTWSMEAGYLGSKNTRLGLPEANLNQLPSQDLSLGSALFVNGLQQQLRAYPRFTSVALFRNNVGNSSYHAAQAKLEKRFSRGLTLSAVYTFSKLIDDASSYFSQTIFTGPVLNNSGAADAFNRHLEKDLSSGDIPRVFSLGWTYEIPRLGKIAGWRIAGLVRVQSGDTVPVTQATNFNASLGYALQRPNRIGDPNNDPTRSAGRWFNTAAFAVAPQFTIGNSSRDPVRGPGLQNADVMLAKTFQITERWNLEFRAEVFNISNTPPLNDPNGSFGSAAFGSITSAGNPRDFEFAAKIHF